MKNILQITLSEYPFHWEDLDDYINMYFQSSWPVHIYDLIAVWSYWMQLCSILNTVMITQKLGLNFFIYPFLFHNPHYETTPPPLFLPSPFSHLCLLLWFSCSPLPAGRLFLYISVGERVCLATVQSFLCPLCVCVCVQWSNCWKWQTSQTLHQGEKLSVLFVW